jgi:PadR family transcriptional regulator AphA
VALRHGLLGLIAARPATGYELAKRFEASLTHVWHAQLSQIYPELARLEESGAIRVSETGPRRRKTYEITDAGLEQLRSWLREEPTRVRRNEGILKAYFLWLLEPGEAERYLRREAEYHRELGRRLERLAESEPVTPSAPLPSEWLLRYCDELARWADRAADAAAAGSGRPGSR